MGKGKKEYTIPISNPTDMTKRRQVYTTQIRHDEHLASLIEKALIILGTKKSGFLRNAIAREAQRVINDNVIHHLTPVDVELFEAALDTPPTPRALESSASYRRWVVSAD